LLLVKYATVSQGFKANPGLEFANTFGVMVDYDLFAIFAVSERFKT
jgi:hypothetical protein